MSPIPKASPAPNFSSPWPWRLGALLVGLVFPLIWVGGLVTSHDAGMAVPDWPTTYGYNMFLYPFSSWFFGPWDFFLEHGHRLLGSAAGLVAIALVAVCFWKDSRSIIQWAAVGLLVMIIIQGLLGGSRVIHDARVLAKVHGCFGPAFFACAAAFCVAVSHWWRETSPQVHVSARERSVWRMTTGLFVLAFLQLVVGAFLRHYDVEASPRGFQHLVYTHVALAFAVLGGTHACGAKVRRLPAVNPRLRRTARWLSLLVTFQFLLGLSTWILKYGWPSWFDGWEPAAGFVIPEKSFWQMNVVTLHVAVGSLIVALWAVQWMRCFRLFGAGERDKLTQEKAATLRANA